VAGATVGDRRHGRGYGLLLLLYVVILSDDAIRKLAAFPAAATGLVYVLTGVLYVVALPGLMLRSRPAPRSLPWWLAMLSLWCAAEAAADHIPVAMALLGWASYVYFVPLFYVGAELMADDRRAASALRIAAIAGGVIGAGAVASALLGQSAPALLQPIVPSAGIHTFSTQNVYLAPSIFATSEEASEHLLIGLFALVALARLPARGLGRAASAVLAGLIIAGLLAAARRADLYVAGAGIAGLALLGVAARPRAGHPRTVRAAGKLGRLWPALAIAALGSAAAFLVAGGGKLVPFLTSGQGGGDALALMFSPAHPAALAGQGPGTSTQGASVVGAIPVTGVGTQGRYAGYTMGGRFFLTAEGGLTKTWLELGIVGVVLYAGVVFSVLSPVVHRLGRLDLTGRALTVLTFALGVVFLKGHQSLDNPLMQPLFWIAAGGAWGRMRSRPPAARPPATAMPDAVGSLTASGRPPPAHAPGL